MDLTVITQVVSKLGDIMDRALPLAIAGIVLSFIKSFYK